MLSVNNIAKEFSGSVLFEGISFNINPKDRVGLAGKNGSGKTTLLNIICGNSVSEKGSITHSEDFTIGYLPQEKKVKSSRTVLEEALQAFGFLNKLQAKIDAINKELQTRLDYESKSYEKMVNDFESLTTQLGLYAPEQLRGDTEKVLLGLGFLHSDFDRPLSTFSHGWQMRVELSKLLLLRPSLLMLDEPTNHLDIESIQWLEQFLISYHGAVLIVSHDRTLLDRVTNRTIEITNGRMYDYKASYTRYIELREERLSHQKAAYSNQQKQVREIEQFVERFRYKASKARQVQSRIKSLDKMEGVELDEVDNTSIHFRFPQAPHSGKVCVEGKQIIKRYGDKTVLSGSDFQVLRGEKIAFVGRNGEGKTTLVKIIAGQLEYQGELQVGHKVVMGYYAQDQWEMLDANKTVFETLDDVAVGDVRSRLNTILGAFLFQGDDIDKKVKVLSGGEKSRLSLAKLLLVPSNLLLLDEPTNHLDLLSKDILWNALMQYTGTLIIVSHDRDFLQGLTDKVFEFRNQQIKEYRGDIFDYLEKRNLVDLKELERKAEIEKPVVETISNSKAKWLEKKDQERQLRKLQTQVKAVEEEIEKLEKTQEEVNQKLAHPDENQDEFKSGELYRQHDQINKHLANAYSSWEQLQVEIDAYEKDMG